jgi:hypothetical protein
MLTRVIIYIINTINELPKDESDYRHKAEIVA